MGKKQKEAQLVSDNWSATVFASLLLPNSSTVLLKMLAGYVDHQEKAPPRERLKIEEEHEKVKWTNVSKCIMNAGKKKKCIGASSLVTGSYVQYNTVQYLTQNFTSPYHHMDSIMCLSI